MNAGTRTHMPEFSPDLLAERAALNSFIDILETEQQALLADQADQLQALADSRSVRVREQQA